MADGRDVKVWTNHAREHREILQHHHVHKEGNVYRLLEIASPKVEKVLDFGCGSGLWRNFFLDFDYYGADQNEEMIKVAKERHPGEKYRFSCHSWDRLDFADKSFDLVFTSAVIQHNRHKDKEIVLKELNRVLALGGYYLCTENTFRPDNFKTTFRHVSEWAPDLDDGYSFTAEGWEKYMKNFGFDLIEYRGPGEYLYVKNREA